MALITKVGLKSECASRAKELCIGTMGYVYQGCEEGKFYPLGMRDHERLKYYASKFNSITIRTTFFGQPKTEIYGEWIGSVSEAPAFKFVVSVPKLVSHARSIKEATEAWKFFWEGNDRRGGCRLLEKEGRLGCLLMEFATAFCYSTRNANRIKALMKVIPDTVRCAVEFRHWSWWENRDKTEALFKPSSNWCIATPYLENGLVDHGWAGSIPSTRVTDDREPVPTVITTNFTFLIFYGTIGKGLGSYDEKCFLEKMVSKIKKYQSQGVETVYCSFNNTESSYCFPLPGLFMMGVWMHPKIKELPGYAHTDLPCCLHDARRLGKVWSEIEECPYKTDEQGHIKMVFC